MCCRRLSRSVTRVAWLFDRRAGDQVARAALPPAEDGGGEGEPDQRQQDRRTHAREQGVPEPVPGLSDHPGEGEIERQVEIGQHRHQGVPGAGGELPDRAGSQPGQQPSAGCGQRQEGREDPESLQQHARQGQPTARPAAAILNAPVERTDELAQHPAGNGQDQIEPDPAQVDRPVVAAAAPCRAMFTK